MRVRIFDTDRNLLDKLSGDVLVLPVFDDGGPTRGFVNQVDWRLHLRVSRVLADTIAATESDSVKFRGKIGDKLLVAGEGRVEFDWLVFLGLGQPESWSLDGFIQVLQQIGESVHGLDQKYCTVVMPDWQSAGLTARSAIERLLKAIDSNNEGNQLDELTVLDSHKQIKEMSEVLASYNETKMVTR